MSISKLNNIYLFIIFINIILVIDVLTKFGLMQKIVVLSADNTNTNFSGLNRKGKNNVQTKL